MKPNTLVGAGSTVFISTVFYNVYDAYRTV